MRRLAWKDAFINRGRYSTTRQIPQTFVGQSGRCYSLNEVIREHPTNPRYDIYQASSYGETFAIKRVSKPIHQLSEQLRREFAGSTHLRMNVDSNVDESVLIYRYSTGTLLSLLRDKPEVSKFQLKLVLRKISEAVKELHDKDWIHLDIKPDNIMIDWRIEDNDQVMLEDAFLGDFDIAFNLPRGSLLRCDQIIGSIFWRSLEGQTGKGLGKCSDIYSLGLVILYALGGQDLIVPPHWKELAADPMAALLREILVQQILYFGPLPQALLDQVDDAQWTKTLQMASKIAEDNLPQLGFLRIAEWPNDFVRDLDVQAKDLIRAMTTLDPTARLTIDQVLEHPWWTSET